MSRVIIYGKQATGKTRNAQKLKEHYACKTITDDWDGVTPLRNETLALTNEEPPYSIKDASIVHIDIALKHINRSRI